MQRCFLFFLSFRDYAFPDVGLKLPEDSRFAPMISSSWKDIHLIPRRF